jgi:uncharacterized protein (DUF1697 family)
VSTRVGFLRAVNVGKRTVPMSRLAEIVGGLGHRDVWTYINSGNVVFDATGRRAAIEQQLEGAFEAAFGFEITTFVRTPAQLRTALALEPFEVVDGDTYFVTFLKEALSPTASAELEALSNDFDTVVVDGTDVHWRMHGKSTDTRIGPRDWAAVAGKLSSTSRNTTMLRKLVDKIG